MSSLKLSKKFSVEVIYRRDNTLCERLDPKILYVLDLKHVTKALTADNLLREVISDWGGSKNGFSIC